MKIRYTPFSERMVIDQPVKGLDFANDMIQMYFMMSLRYRECYYKQRPQGNTVYFMNYPEASLLFYFAAGMRSYRVNGFRIEKEERRKAWIYMLPLIQSLRAYDFGRKEGTKQLEDDFLDHMLDMEEVLSGTLVPFHFILSSLPKECFPVCQEVRLFNRCAVEHAEKKLFTGNKKMISGRQRCRRRFIINFLRFSGCRRITDTKDGCLNITQALWKTKAGKEKTIG